MVLTRDQLGERTALLDGIYWHPDDLDRRLIYGDWLMECGDDREQLLGEFVKVQTALAMDRKEKRRTKTKGDGRVDTEVWELRKRQKELCTKAVPDRYWCYQQVEIAKPATGKRLPPRVTQRGQGAAARYFEYKRWPLTVGGFLPPDLYVYLGSNLNYNFESLSDPTHWLTMASVVVAHTCDYKDFERLARDPDAARIAQLSLKHDAGKHGARILDALQDAVFLPGLRAFRWNNRSLPLNADASEVLLATLAAKCQRLETLSINGNSLSPRAFAQFQHEAFADLQHLDLNMPFLITEQAEWLMVSRLPSDCRISARLTTAARTALRTWYTRFPNAQR